MSNERTGDNHDILGSDLNDSLDQGTVDISCENPNLSKDGKRAVVEEPKFLVDI